MTVPKLDSADWRERLQAVHDLGRDHVGSSEILPALLQAVHDREFCVAYEAVRSLALLGDSSVVPRLIEERQAVIREWNTVDGFIDTSERSIEGALTMAIISLMSPDECNKLLQTGDDFEKYMVRRKYSVASTEEFWGPI